MLNKETVCIFKNKFKLTQQQINNQHNQTVIKRLPLSHTNTICVCLFLTVFNEGA